MIVRRETWTRLLFAYYTSQHRYRLFIYYFYFITLEVFSLDLSSLFFFPFLYYNICCADNLIRTVSNIEIIIRYW